MKTHPSTTLASLLFVAATASAGSLDITVTDRDGQPAADVVVLVQAPGQAVPRPTAAPVVVTQENLRFVPFLTVVPVGSTLRFVNQDSYDHHVRSVPSGPLGSMPAAEHFELRLDAAKAPPRSSSYDDEYKTAAAPAKKSGSTSADVTVSRAGPIGLGCHIHGSMRGQVYVSATPYFAKTDAKGIARIEGVPEGAAEVTLWHPDQLQEQPPVKVQVEAGPSSRATGQLNFTPRRRKA
jgi:plastocyanin